MFLFRKFFTLDKEYIDALSHAGTIGLHMVSGIAVGTLIGYALDAWLETSPWLTGVFIVVGIVAGYINVYRDTKKLVRAQEEQDRASAFSQDENESGQNADKNGKP